MRDRLAAWVLGQLNVLGDADPDLPVEDRAADVWEPLVAIADAAGGDWPDRARKACTVMTGAVEPDDATASERLLADLRIIFDRDPANPEKLLLAPHTHLPTEVILERLNALDESLWGDWYGKGLDARGLAKMLRPYGIRSRNVRDGSVQAKNYLRADLDLDEVWARYTRPGRPNVPDKLSPHVNAGTDSGTDDAGGIRPCR